MEAGRNVQTKAEKFNPSSYWFLWNVVRHILTDLNVRSRTVVERNKKGEHCFFSGQYEWHFWVPLCFFLRNSLLYSMSPVCELVSITCYFAICSELDMRNAVFRAMAKRADVSFHFPPPHPLSPPPTPKLLCYLEEGSFRKVYQSDFFFCCQEISSLGKILWFTPPNEVPAVRIWSMWMEPQVIVERGPCQHAQNLRGSHPLD